MEESNLPIGIKQYLTNFMENILEKYQTNNLSEYGCIYLLCSTEDMNLQDFSVLVKDIPFEYCEQIQLTDSHGEVTLLHGCYVLNNDFAVDIFGLENIFDKKTRQIMLDNLIE